MSFNLSHGSENNKKERKDLGAGEEKEERNLI